MLSQKQAPMSRCEGVALALGVLCLLGWPGVAKAVCLGVPATVIWSSPARGASDVTLDSDLLLIVDGTYERDIEVTLNGALLAPESELPGHYEMGQLAEATNYAVRTFVEAIEPIEWTFTTGSDSEPEASEELTGTTFDAFSARGR